ncbi:MAG: YggT family protein [Propionibacteriaceae bacterium]
MGLSIVGFVIGLLLQIYFMVLLARMVFSWVPVLVHGWEPRGPVLVVCEVVYSLTDPPLRLLRKVFRPVRIGTMSFDIAFLALVILLSVVMWVNRVVFY